MKRIDNRNSFNETLCLQVKINCSDQNIQTSVENIKKKHLNELNDLSTFLDKYLRFFTCRSI